MSRKPATQARAIGRVAESLLTGNRAAAGFVCWRLKEPRAEEAAEKSRIWSEIGGKRPSGAKAPFICWLYTGVETPVSLRTRVFPQSVKP